MPRLFAALLLALTPMLASAEEVIRVYNWNDYIAPQVLKDFEAETGIRVDYHTYSTTEELAAVLATGEAIDVAVPSHDALPAMIKSGTLQPLDFSLLPNRKHLDKQLLSTLVALDPANRHAVPYLWGAVGLAINTPQAEAAFGGPLPNSWSLLFDAEQSARLASCGISVLDAPDETLTLRAAAWRAAHRAVSNAPAVCWMACGRTCATSTASAISRISTRASCVWPWPGSVMPWPPRMQGSPCAF